ncbi:response regulator [Acetobacteraceae bacterium H6797]|nr:response regulator [Acetobacteraceae bacterium H6797]
MQLADKHSAEPPPPPGKGTHVLVVDDNVEIRDLIAIAVRRAGAEAVTLASTEVAAALRQYPVFAVITDVMMPDRDGLEVLDDVVSFDPSISVLLISGYGPFYLGIAARLAGPLNARHVETQMKPVRLRDIIAFVERARARGDEPVAGAPAAGLPPRTGA